MDKQIRFAEAIAEVDRAVEKVRDEMAASKDPAVQAVGEIMTMYLKAHPDAAGAVLADGKSLQGAYKHMEDYVRKNRGGSTVVCVEPRRAEELMLEHYGIKPPAEALAPVQTAAPLDELDLDALLEV